MLIAAAAPFAYAAEIERTGGPFVPTPIVVVQQMLRIGNIGPKDFVIDLGSGDGIIVLTAATQNQASGMGERPHASLVIAENGQEKKADAQGDGPVDATFKAIESVAKSGAELLLFSVNAVTQGTESQGEVTVRLSKGGRIVNGVGADTDIVVASAKAYISALNKLSSKTERVNPQYQPQA